MSLNLKELRFEASMSSSFKPPPSLWRGVNGDFKRYAPQFASNDLPVDGATACYLGPRLIGVFRYCEAGGGLSLFDAGMYILKPYRRNGIGLKLLITTMDTIKPISIALTPVNPAGTALAEKFAKLYPRQTNILK